MAAILRPPMKLDLTLSLATIVVVMLAAFGGHRAFCEVRILLQELVKRFDRHEERADAETRRLDGRLDQQRELIHATERRVDGIEALVKPVKRG